MATAERQQRDFLFKRVSEIERRVFGGGVEKKNDNLLKGSFSSPESIELRIKSISDETNNKFEDSFKEFLSKYKSSPLYSSFAKGTSPSFLEADTQLELLLVGGESISKTMLQLEEVDQLKGCINTDKFRDIGEHVQRIARLEPGFVDVMTRAQKMNKRVGEITDKYDVMINTLSEKLFRWDAVLTEWENQQQRK